MISFDRIRDPLVIAAAIAMATPVAVGLVKPWEGERRVTYLDVAGIPTACFGSTGPEVGRIGKQWTASQCELMLNQDVREHMTGLLRCAPGLVAKPAVLGAATSFTYNVGVSAACGSTAIRRFNRQDWSGGCDALGPYFDTVQSDGSRLRVSGFIKVNGQVVRGLVNRRTAERARCLAGI